MDEHFHICSFDAVELPKKKLRDDLAVLQELHRVGKFSVWEAAAGDASLGNTINHLKREGLIETDTDSIGFPWTKVTLTAAGMEKLPNG